METINQPYNRESGKVYIGIPSGSLEKKTKELLRTGKLLNGDNSREYEFPSRREDLVFRICDRIRIATLVALGVVDFGITGKDYIAETGQTDNVVVVKDLIFSRNGNNPSRLVLASDPNLIQTIEQCRGARIATELPNLTRQQLKKKLGFTEKDVSGIYKTPGKTETEVLYGLADAISEIADSGATLRENNLEIIGQEALFESNPQIIANPTSVKQPEIRELIEDVSTILFSVLESERNPQSLVTMNVPSTRLEEVLRILPCKNSPTTNSQLDPNWIEVEIQIPQADVPMLAARLLTMGVDGIVDTTQNISYGQDTLVQIPKKC